MRRRKLHATNKKPCARKKLHETLTEAENDMQDNYISDGKKLNRIFIKDLKWKEAPPDTLQKPKMNI